MSALLFVSITFIFVNINVILSKLCQNGDYHCSDRNGLEHLEEDEECCDQAKRCDGYVDCPFGDDEHNCPEMYPNGWTCPSDGTYIPKEWSCENGADTKMWDCPNQDDVDPINCFQCDSADESSDDSFDDSDENSGWFQCKDNGRCIPKRYTCDGEYDCMDKSDESIGLCGHLSVSVVTHPTVMTPSTMMPTPAPHYGPTSTTIPSQTPSESPTKRPTRKPSKYPTTKPTPAPTKKPSISPISEPTEYFPPTVYIKMYISDIVDMIDDEQTIKGIIKSLAEVLPITKDMILNVNIVRLTDILNDGDDIPISLIPQTKWNKWKQKGKTGKTREWKSWKADKFGIRNYVSVVVDIDMDSIDEYHVLMDHLFGQELGIFNTQLSLEHELMDAMSISNTQVQIDKVSTFPIPLS